MILSLFSGILLVFFLYFIRILIVYIISKLNYKNFIKNFEFDFIQFLFELFLFGLIFLCFDLIDNTLTTIDYIQHIVCILLISLIPTYVYVIQPILFLINKNNFINNNFINNIEIKTYDIRIINMNLVNAYATGIIPFSKTILIGKPLIEGLNKEELLSIIFHETGHLEKKHLNKLYFVNILLSIIFYFLLIIRSKYLILNNEFLNIIIIGLLGCLYGFLLWYIPGKIQYKFELEADKFSVRKNGKENLINALKKLDILSEGEVSKGGITHPNLSIRIDNINKL